MEIPINQFEQFIDETILKRGLSYFKNGHINEPEEISPGYYEAIVEGTEDYIVKLTLKNDIITEHVCNCPYDYGPVCKHVAGVIFHLQQEELEIKKKKPRTGAAKKKPKKRKTKADQIIDLLEKISPDELKQFIVEKTTQNRSFRDLFLASFAHHNTNESKELYLKQVKQILRSASDGYGFIDWSASRQVGAEIYSLLDSAQKQLESKNYKSAIFICTAVMEQMTEALQYSDDSNGDIGGSIDYAFEMLHIMAEEELPEEIRKLILDYCTKAFEKNIYSGMDWHTGMLNVALILLKTNDESELILKLIDKIQGSEYEQEEAQSIKYSILINVKGKKEADKFLEQNIGNSKLRRIAIENAIENKNYEKARLIALNGVKHDKKDKPGLAKEWYDWLLKIAQATNNKEKIIEYARFLFIDNFRHEQDYYQILKQNIPPEKWSNYVREIIEDITAKKRWLDTRLISGIYIREEWWDKLLLLVEKSPDLNTISHYEKYLSNDYSDELVKLYSYAIVVFLKNNMGRKHYQNACRYLRRIIKLGGRQKANELIAEFRTEYPKRKALMEELNKV